MTPSSSLWSLSPDRDVTACPICHTRMELYSRRGGFVSAGCDPCQVRLTIPESAWNRAAAKASGTDA